MANPNLPGWLAGILTPAGAVFGVVAGKLIDRWRNRRQDRALVEVHEASAADTLVGTAMGLLDQMRTELESLRVQLGQCRDERRLQEEVLIALRSLIEQLTRERDQMRNLLDEATRPR